MYSPNRHYFVLIPILYLHISFQLRFYLVFKLDSDLKALMDLMFKFDLLQLVH